MKLRHLPKILFFLLLVRPLITFILGVTLRHRERLPVKGPAILIANHNSHLDTMLLMNLFSLGRLKDVRPAAAEDFFFKNPLMRFFATYFIGCLPVKRRDNDKQHDPLVHVHEALHNNQIVIFFPEGTRGAPEVMSEFKKGISKIAQAHPQVPIVPIFLYGLGKSMPKDDFIIVPFIAKVIVGEHFYWNNDFVNFPKLLEQEVIKLSQEAEVQPWFYQ